MSILYMSLCLLYAMAWGAILESFRHIIFLFIRQSPNEAVPILAKFAIIDIYSKNEFSDYPVYIEVMLLPIFAYICGIVFFKIINIKKKRDVAINYIKHVDILFKTETVLGVVLLSLMATFFSGYKIIEILNPQTENTTIAIMINYMFFTMLGLIFIAFVIYTFYWIFCFFRRFCFDS